MVVVFHTQGGDELMWDNHGEYVSWQNSVALANAGNDYGPQFGPANPRSFYYEPQLLGCGHTSEDCDGVECGRILQEPPDLDYWLGQNP
jgi:hypothetical protein